MFSGFSTVQFIEELSSKTPVQPVPLPEAVGLGSILGKDPVCHSMPYRFITYSLGDYGYGYHPNALYTILEERSEVQVCSRFNRGYCKHQEDSYCIWIPKTGGAQELSHICSFVLPCCGLLCGSKEQSAREHKLLPSHCWTCYTTMVKKAKIGPKFIKVE